jgi:hypothetical protein
LKILSMKSPSRRKTSYQKWIGHDEYSIGTFAAQHQECVVKAVRIRRLHEVELQAQSRCPEPCLPHGDGAVRVARVRKHRDPRKAWQQLLEQFHAK